MPSVLITGASRGIGHAAALHLAAAGWTVYAGMRSVEPLGDRITPVKLDITNDDHIAALAELPPLDAVVNNAGIVVGGPVEALDLDDLRHQLEVNVVGQIAVTQALLPGLRSRRGRVVFVSSVNGKLSAPMMGAYSASKFALEALADSLRVELRPWRIGVSLIEPGAIDTALWQDVMETIAETESRLQPRHRELYASHVAGLRQAAATIQKSTSPVEKVAAAIERALIDRRPKARYPVGLDARGQSALLRFAPTWALDELLARVFRVAR